MNYIENKCSENVAIRFQLAFEYSDLSRYRTKFSIPLFPPKIFFFNHKNINEIQ